MILFEYSLPFAWIIAAMLAVACAGLYSAWRFLPRRIFSCVLFLVFLAASLLLLWTILQPAKREAVTELVKPRFIVALDTSESMTVAPHPDAQDRWKAARRALAMRWTRELGPECLIEVVPFDAKAGPILSLSEADALSPTGTSTMIREALRDITGRYAGLNVAGMLLLSDGLDTREAFDDWAHEERPFPIHTALLEAEAEWEREPDLRVDSVTTPRRATRNWSTELKALVYGQGTDSKPVSVQLFKDGVLKDEVPTRIPATGGRREVTFTLEHPDPGVFTYRVFMPPLDGEVNTNDNEYAVSVHVAEDRNRLLYVEGVPRWEYRFLRRALLGIPNLTPTIFYIGPDGAPRRGSPDDGITADMTETELANFNIVILGNLDAEELTEERAANLVRFVDTGGSLVLLGGNKAWGENGFRRTSLRKIMPATAHASTPLEADLSEIPFAVRITDEAMAHPAFAGEREYWDALPPVLSVFPGATASAGAEVLAKVDTDRGPQPMILSHRYGEGKVTAIFSDSLWRWQLSPDEGRKRPYHRFWSQLTLWMLPEYDEIDERSIHLFAEHDRLFLGDEIEISARVHALEDEVFEQVQLRISFPDERDVPYTMRKRHIMTPSGDTFEGYAVDFNPGMPGLYKAVATAGEGEHGITSGPLSFFVQPHSQETAPRPVNADVLKALAAASGGRFFETLDELNEGLSAIRTAAIEEEHAHVYSLWQRWPVIASIMILLVGAWTMRKLRNMP